MEIGRILTHFLVLIEIDKVMMNIWNKLER